MNSTFTIDCATISCFFEVQEKTLEANVKCNDPNFPFRNLNCLIYFIP